MLPKKETNIKEKSKNFKEKDDRIWWEKTSVIVDTKPIRFSLSFYIGLFLFLLYYEKRRPFWGWFQKTCKISYLYKEGGGCTPYKWG